jgi:hypothetical protein
MQEQTNSTPSASQRHMRETHMQLAEEMHAQEYVVLDKHIEDSEVIEQIQTFGGILCTRRTPLSRYML